MTKYSGQKQLMISSLTGLESIMTGRAQEQGAGAGSWSRKLANHLSIHMEETRTCTHTHTKREKEGGGSGEATDSQSPSPVTFLLHHAFIPYKVPQHPPKTTTGDQVFKYVILWGPFPIHIITAWYPQICTNSCF